MKKNDRFFKIGIYSSIAALTLITIISLVSLVMSIGGRG